MPALASTIGLDVKSAKRARESSITVIVSENTMADALSLENCMFLLAPIAS